MNYLLKENIIKQQNHIMNLLKKIKMIKNV